LFSSVSPLSLIYPFSLHDALPTSLRRSCFSPLVEFPREPEHGLGTGVCVCQAQGASVLLRDRVANREAQSGALADGLGGEEGVEDAIQGIACDPRAGVSDSELEVSAYLPRGDDDRARLLDGVHGVGHQVEQEEVEWPGVALDLLGALQAQLDLDAISKSMPQDEQH